MKPSDRWTISLCRDHHAEQHRIGEVTFELRHKIDLASLAEEFFRRSPYQGDLRLGEVSAGQAVGALAGR